MSSNIEIEAKVLITKEQYLHVIDSLQLDKYLKYKQTNYYIDTPNSDIKKNGFALRVREKNESFELTLKTPLSEGLLEKNENISWRVFEELHENNVFPNGGIKKFLAILGINCDELRIVTSLTTDRIKFEYKGASIAVDKSTYSKQVDYELEAESTSVSNAQEALTKLLEECGITSFEFNSVSKQARALNALKK